MGVGGSEGGDAGGGCGVKIYLVFRFFYGTLWMLTGEWTIGE